MEDLKHIYFFLQSEGKSSPTNNDSPSSDTVIAPSRLTIDIINHPADKDVNPTTSQDSAYSPDSTASTAATAGSSALRCDSVVLNTSPLKASAAAFVPVSASIATDPCFEVRPIPGKGLGVFAVRDIGRGTRVLTEAPLMQLSFNRLDNAIEQYERLSVEDKATYDKLHFHNSEALNLEQAARVRLFSTKGGDTTSSDNEEIVANYIRIMGTFSVNNFILSDGSLGVFRTGSRFNHSCIPNIFHTHNPNLREETFHAVRDIRADEELVINYLGAESYYQSHLQRWNRLRNEYGFTCTCQSCTDTSGTSSNRRDLLGRILWGLNEYRDGKPPDVFVPSSPLMALVQAEDAIMLMMQEGIFTTELGKAYRIASELSLAIGEAPKAMEYGLNSEEVEFNIFGPEVQDLEKAGIAAKQWLRHVYETAGLSRRGLGNAFWRNFPKRQHQYRTFSNVPSITSPHKRSWRKKPKQNREQPTGSQQV